MSWVVIIFILAFVLIIKGGDLLVEASINIAKKAKIPSMIVGATVVAIATTFPEVSVSVMSGLSGADELSLSTAFGSMVCNFALVLGLSFLVSPTGVKTAGVAKKFLFFLGALTILLVVSADNHLSSIDGFVLFGVFIVFVTQNIIEARNSPDPKILKPETLPGWWTVIIQFVLSAFSVGFGANIMVKNVEGLSAFLGLSEGLVGTFIIAIGTNIPEFVTTITSIRLKDAEMGIGNIFGASIIDASLLIAATVCSSSGSVVAVPSGLVWGTIPILAVIAAVVAIPILKNQKSSRLQGALLLALFILYSIIIAKIS